jgi:hypothetical protein
MSSSSSATEHTAAVATTKERATGLGEGMECHGQCKVELSGPSICLTDSRKIGSVHGSERGAGI